MTKARARLQQLKERPIHYFPEKVFNLPVVVNKIMGPMPDEAGFKNKQAVCRKLSSTVEADLRHLYENPLLTYPQEVYLFRKFNCCKYQAARHINGLKSAAATQARLDVIEKWLARASECSHLLVSCNSRLVANLAKKQGCYMHSKSHDLLMEIISDGNVALIRSVDKYDYRRGFKFSTYLTWAIRRACMAGYKGRDKHSSNSVSGLDWSDNDFPEPIRNDPDTDEHRDLYEAIDRVFVGPYERLRNIVLPAFGIGGFQTLEEIGNNVGFCKERARQLRDIGVDMLRESLLGKKK